VGFGEDQWISTLNYALTIDDYITQNALVMDRNDPQKKLAFAVDEWGTWYDPEPGREAGFLYQQNTLRDALVAAVSLNIFHHHADRVRMTNIAQMINVLQAMILTDGPRMILTPTYHVFRMFIPFQDATLLPTDLAVQRYALGKLSIPAMSVSAARTRDGSLVVALVNSHPGKPLPVTVDIAGATPSHVTGEVLTAPDMDAHNTFDHPTAVHPVALSGATLNGGTLSLTLPPKSVVVVRLD
jgi:alpha-N-arabinofuranosidase